MRAFVGRREVFNWLPQQAPLAKYYVAFQHATVSGKRGLLGEVNFARPPPTFTKYVGHLVEFAENVKQVMNGQR
jgi:hypothetical protein